MIKKVKYSDLENITKIIETYRIKRQEKINNEINLLMNIKRDY